MDIEQREKNRFSWWHKRTKVEKCSLLIITVCLLLILYLASNLFMKFPSSSGNPDGRICMTEKCIRTAAQILDKMDQKADPCEDFYMFACGNYLKKTVISEEKGWISGFSTVRDQVDQQLKKIFEDPIKDTDQDFIKLTKGVYKSCMNITKIQNESVRYVEKIFKELGGWPLLETSHWNEKLFDWKKLLYRLRKIGWRYNYFLNMYVGVDSKNSSKRMLKITQPCMAYERLKKGLSDTTVQAYYNYLVDLATLFGADRMYASVELREVVEFEVNFANIIIPNEERKNSSLEYNPMTIRELQREFPSIPWLQFINVYLSPIDMLSSDDVVNVGLPKFLKNMENLLLKTKKRILANYMYLGLIKSVIYHLPEVFRKRHLEYMKVIYGVSQINPRWKQCVLEATRLNIATSAVYVKNYFNKSSKRKVTELVLDIKSAFYETLKKTGWMDKKTKKQALLKAERMNSWIGYPDELLDDEKVEEIYQGLEINPEGYYFEIRFNISLFSHMRGVKKLREPVTRPDWESQAYSIFYVNAYYSQSDNAMEFPAAILQEHFFDGDRPQYMNYGSIGYVIGHEITHGFDDTGRQYDKDGNLVDWWEPETNRTFCRKSQCLVEQYGNYTVPEINQKLNALNTLGENIADNGGIKIAYKGYLKWIERNKGEIMLPGLKYSPRQMFWISAATTWCSKFRKEALKQFVSSGVHAPYHYRVVVPFMNSDNFGRDFNCPLGTPMNPKYKCRIW